MLEQPIKADLLDLSNVLSWAKSMYKDMLESVDHRRRYNDEPIFRKSRKQQSMWFGHSPRWKLTVQIVNRRNGDGTIGRYPAITYVAELEAK